MSPLGSQLPSPPLVFYHHTPTAWSCDMAYSARSDANQSLGTRALKWDNCTLFPNQETVELPSSGRAMRFSLWCRDDVSCGSHHLGEEDQRRVQPWGHYISTLPMLLRPWQCQSHQDRLCPLGFPPCESQASALALERAKDFAISKRSNQEWLLNLWITVKWGKPRSLEVKDVEWTIPNWMFLEHS